MSYQPYMYNNGTRPNPQQTFPRNPRQSQTLITGNSYQFPGLQTGKLHDSMGKSQESQSKNNQFKPYSSGNIETGHGRIVTEPNGLGNITKPITPSQQNYNHYQPPGNLYQGQGQIGKPGGNQLFKSSIYGSNQNSNSLGLAEKASLNLSGGKPSNNANIGITPPRKLPRVSEPTLPSETNSYNEYMKGSNNNTADSSSMATPDKEQPSNFNKIRQFVVDSPNKAISMGEKPPSLNENSRQKTRKGSADLTEALYRPMANSKGLRKKIGAQDFEKIKELGSGKYGRVYLVRQKLTGFVCALKCVEKKLLQQEQITEQFIRELKIQMFLNHPHIIKMFGFFEDMQTIYLILEVGTGGQLFHQLKKQQAMPEAKVATTMRQICDAVREIHSLRIIHRDIKPENIVLHDNVIKLCDFGWSVHQDNNLRTTFCGTPLYVCPEILKGKQYDEKIDIWSLGIMMYEMLVGENPFKITKEEQLIKIIKQEVCIPSYVTLTKEAKDFLDKCLKKNPVERVTIRELMEHDFFKKYPDKQSQKNKMMGL